MTSEPQVQAANVPASEGLLLRGVKGVSRLGWCNRVSLEFRPASSVCYETDVCGLTYG